MKFSRNILLTADVLPSIRGLKSGEIESKLFEYEVDLPGVTVSQGVNATLEWEVQDDVIGDQLIPYETKFCDGKEFKVWTYGGTGSIPNDGFFFNERREDY